MNYPQAIVAAAGILAGAIVLGNFAQTAPAGFSGEKTGRYQIAAAPGQSVANAWRLDRRTGEVYRCFATGGGYGGICRQARFFDPGDSEDHSSGGNKAGLGPGGGSARAEPVRRFIYPGCLKIGRAAPPPEKYIRCGCAVFQFLIKTIDS